MEDAILLAEHRKTHRQGCQLGCRDSQPDTVDAQKLRQHQNRRHLKQQRAQERNQSAGDAIPQCGKKRRCIDVISHNEKTQTVEPERPRRKRQQLRVVAHKEPCHLRDEEHGPDGQHHRHLPDQAQAHTIQVVNLAAVPGAVMVADDGGIFA